MDFTFFDWSYLATFAGCLLAVGIFTELIKNIGFIKKIPTQIFSWVLALIVLVLAQAFTTGITAESAILAVVNSAVVSLAANGGYEALNRLTGKKTE